MIKIFLISITITIIIIKINKYKKTINNNMNNNDSKIKDNCLFISNFIILAYYFLITINNK